MKKQCDCRKCVNCKMEEPTNVQFGGAMVFCVNCKVETKQKEFYCKNYQERKNEYGKEEFNEEEPIC